MGIVVPLVALCTGGAKGLGFRVWGLGFRIWGLGLGFRVYGLGFRV